MCETGRERGCGGLWLTDEGEVQLSRAESLLPCSSFINNSTMRIFSLWIWRLMSLGMSGISQSTKSLISITTFCTQQKRKGSLENKSSDISYILSNSYFTSVQIYLHLSNADTFIYQVLTEACFAKFIIYLFNFAINMLPNYFPLHLFYTISKEPFYICRGALTPSISYLQNKGQKFKRCQWFYLIF